MRGGNCLLPVGVAAVTGNFRRGDVVTMVNGHGTELGRGLVEYSSDEAARIMGCRTEHIMERLGYRGRSVMLHRDELVLFENDS